MTTRKKWFTLTATALVIAFYGGYKLLGSTGPLPAFSSSASTPAAPRIDRSVPELQTAVGKPLPEARLVDDTGTPLGEEALRRGRVMLVLVNPKCEPCKKEGEFLRTLIDKHPGVRFYGVVSLGERVASLKESEALFPFKTFFDEEARLAHQLGIARVPIKIFLEDGVVKKTWGGASSRPELRADFAEWLGSLE